MGELSSPDCLLSKSYQNFVLAPLPLHRSQQIAADALLLGGWRLEKNRENGKTENDVDNLLAPVRTSYIHSTRTFYPIQSDQSHFIFCLFSLMSKIQRLVSFTD